MTDKRPNHFKKANQTDFKEAKANKKTISGTKRNKGVITKFQPKKRKVCNPVKLLK